MPYTDDPVADFHCHDAERQQRISVLPVCCECDHPITDETLFLFDGEYICHQCVKDNHLRYTEDFTM